MSDAADSAPRVIPGDEFARALASGEAASQALVPVLRLRLGHDPEVLLSEQLVARVRAMLRGLVQHLLPDGEGPAVEQLELALTMLPGVLDHLLALALEAASSAALRSRLRLDPVVSPLLQALVGSDEAETATTAMHVLAAEARFQRHQQEMRLPLLELPAELLHAVLTMTQEHSSVANIEAVRRTYDEAETRIALAARLIAGMGNGAAAALALAHAGVALFATALAAAAGERRERCILALQPGQEARLALLLRSTGVKLATVQASLAALDTPEVLVMAISRMAPEDAVAQLAGCA